MGLDVPINERKELSLPAGKTMPKPCRYHVFQVIFANILKVISKSCNKIDLFFQTPYNRHIIKQDINAKQLSANLLKGSIHE